MNLEEVISEDIRNHELSGSQVKVKIMDATLSLLVQDTKILVGMLYGPDLDPQIIALLQNSQDVDPDGEDRVLPYDLGQKSLSFAAIANPDSRLPTSTLWPNQCSLLKQGDSCWNDVHSKGGYIILQRYSI